MYSRHQSNWVIVYALTAVLIVSGCATTTTPYWKTTAYGTWVFSHAELEKLPNVSIRNILSSVSVNENEKVHILVKAQNIDGIAEVKRIAGQEDVIVANVHGQEVKIKITKITEIQSNRQIKIKPRQKTTDKTAEELGEGLSYVPLIPVAIASWPFLRGMGLDAGKNDADKEKARLAYGGMSKEELVTYIGKPMEKYRCEGKYGDNEIWIYERDQVLRGGRALFIGLDDGVVYHTSHDTTFFKDSNSLNCSLLMK